MIAAVKLFAAVLRDNVPTSVCNCVKAPVIVLLPDAILLILTSPILSSCSLIAVTTVLAVVPRLLVVTSPILPCISVIAGTKTVCV